MVVLVPITLPLATAYTVRVPAVPPVLQNIIVVIAVIPDETYIAVVVVDAMIAFVKAMFFTLKYYTINYGLGTAD